jgi:predicted O-methyltransferase YrrM
MILSQALLSPCRSGPEKGAILEDLIVRQKPQVWKKDCNLLPSSVDFVVKLREAFPSPPLLSAHSLQLVLELGTFIGYGTVRIARALPPGGRVISIEADEDRVSEWEDINPMHAAFQPGIIISRIRYVQLVTCTETQACAVHILHPTPSLYVLTMQADVARQVLSLAGSPASPSGKVEVVLGLSTEVLPAIAASLPPETRTAGLVFLDHCKSCYLRDLLLMERLGIVGPGTIVIADNVKVRALDNSFWIGKDMVFHPVRRMPPQVPGAPDFMAHVTQDQASLSTSGCTYETRLVDATYEVEERYKKDWRPQLDAMSVSVCIH